MRYLETLDFTNEYRNTFVDFCNLYYKGYDGYERRGKINSEMYVWLTKNVNKMQGHLGLTGIMHYVAPFQMYQIPNYQILINTLPKFREGKVDEFDVNSSDDALLRYIGILEQSITNIKKKLHNPIMWFKDGFYETMSLPIYLFNWFGLFSDNLVYKIKANILYKLILGIAGLVTFLSGIITILVGVDGSIVIVNRIFHTNFNL